MAPVLSSTSGPLPWFTVSSVWVGAVVVCVGREVATVVSSMVGSRVVGVVTAPFRFVQPQPVSIGAEMSRLIYKDAKAFISFPPEFLVAELLFPLLFGLAWKIFPDFSFPFCFIDIKIAKIRCFFPGFQV